MQRGRGLRRPKSARPSVRSSLLARDDNEKDMEQLLNSLLGSSGPPQPIETIQEIASAEQLASLRQLCISTPGGKWEFSSLQFCAILENRIMIRELPREPITACMVLHSSFCFTLRGLSAAAMEFALHFLLLSIEDPDHSRRYRALLVIDLIFRSSERFRRAFVPHLPAFIKHTIAAKPGFLSLPPLCNIP